MAHEDFTHVGGKGEAYVPFAEPAPGRITADLQAMCEYMGLFNDLREPRLNSTGKMSRPIDDTSPLVRSLSKHSAALRGLRSYGVTRRR